MSVEEIGCCGAYCRTCKVFATEACKGCKVGYKSGERDICKAKCKIKVCCITKKFNSCADCTEYDACAIMQQFLNHSGHKYVKYSQAIMYIKNNGYDAFLEKADSWGNAYGKY